MELHRIKHIIFDLGGVILNLREESTVEAFAAISRLSKAEISKRFFVFDDYPKFEMGLLTDSAFRQSVRSNFDIEAEDERLDAALNAMLLDIPLARLELLDKLKTSFRLFLLSNTNNIHLGCFNNKVRELTGEGSLERFFIKSYYSHQVKLRKPDPSIFKLVLDEQHCKPEETLFLDDNQSNLDGAATLGISTFHIKNPDQLFELFT